MLRTSAPRVRRCQPHIPSLHQRKGRGMSQQLRGASRAWVSTEQAYNAANLEFADAIGRRAPEAELLARAHQVAALQDAHSEASATAGWRLTGWRRPSVVTLPTTLA